MKRLFLNCFVVGALSGFVAGQGVERDPFATGEGLKEGTGGGGAGADPFADPFGGEDGGGGGGGGGGSGGADAEDPFADNSRAGAGSPGGNYDPTKDPFADPRVVRSFVQQQRANADGAGKGKRVADAGLFVVDSIEVPQARLRRFAMSEGIGTDAGALWAEVQGWLEEGVAERVGSSAVTVSGSHWARVFGGKELIYPTEFEPHPLSPSPTAFETRVTGISFQLDEVVMGGGMLQVSPSGERVRYVGESPGVGGDPEYTEGTIRMPLFETQKAHAEAVRLVDGKPVLLDVRTSLDGAGQPENESSLLVFLRGAILPRPAGDGAAAKRGVITLLLVDVAAEALDAWFESEGTTAAGFGLWPQVEAWLESGEAEDVDLQVIPVSEGKPAQGESVLEFVYPTSYHASSPSLEEPSLATAFETRNLGSVFVANLNAGRVPFFEVVASVTASAGSTVHRYRAGGDGGRVADVTMPVITDSSISTRIDAAYLSGGPLLLGVTTPSGADGELEPGRRLVLFGKLKP